MSDHQPANLSPASSPVQYRKKPVPDQYNAQDTPMSSGCLLSLSGIGLSFYFLSQVAAGNFGSAFFSICAFAAIYVFAKMYELLSAAVAHLGAIRWLLRHGDEVEPVPDPSSRTTPSDKQKGPQLSNKAFTITCIVLLALIIGGLILYNHLPK